jgi:NOL1/NOP2/sun family putative RNA methylase
MSLPSAFTDGMRGLLRAEADGFFNALSNKSAVNGLRCNTLKLEPPQLKELLGIPLSPVPWCAEGFTYETDGETRPSKSPLYHAGLFYLQEPSAMAPAAILDARPGERVLDLCAAPGGKSVQLAGRLRGQGALVSNDLSATRGRALVKNLALCGAVNAVVTFERPDRLAARFVEYFDKILVDAPCSGEGMFRKDGNAAKGWTANKPEACAQTQRALLRHAAGMLKPRGRLVYSTCTFNTRENEDVIEGFLNERADFSIVPLDSARLGLSEGFLEGSARAWPHRANGEGHFICLLEKGGAFEETAPRKSETQTAPAFARTLFERFCDAHLTKTGGALLDGAGLALYGDALYAENRDVSGLLRGLRVARGGRLLGELRKDRFEPSHTLALSLRKEDARYAADFSPDAEGCARYLRGESLDAGTLGNEAADEKAYVLVCVAGFPLGWARLAGGRLKNRYPQEWV